MTEESRVRYSRLMAIEEIGVDGLKKLNDAKVVVVGCGALGSMAAMQLAASGIGRIRIVDFDTIDISNLQRQFFFSTSEAGLKKAEILADRIHKLNPGTEVEVMTEMLTSTNGMQIIERTDFVVEATDNPSSMILIDRLCEEKGIPCVFAGVTGFSGQVITCLPGGRRYIDVFPEAGDSGFMPCSMNGVTGQAAAVAASIQAVEVMKHILGIKSLLADKLLLFDLLHMRFDLIET